MSEKENEYHNYGLMQIAWKMDNLVAFGMFWFDQSGKLIHHQIDWELARKVCETFIGKGVYESLNLTSYETEDGKRQLYENLTLDYWNSLHKKSNGIIRYSKTAKVAVPKFENRHFDQLWNLAI